MALVLAVQTDKIEGVDQIRERLGNSGNVRNAVTPLLREAARVGATAARAHAPRGATGRLEGSIDDDAIVFRIRGDEIAARFGVQPVMELYGHLHRIIRPRRHKYMIFPGGGSSAGGFAWPTEFGRTGRVVASSVRGQRPNPYMTKAYEEARIYVDAHLNQVINRLID
jgi:hypothetical protein